MKGLLTYRTIQFSKSRECFHSKSASHLGDKKPQCQLYLATRHLSYLLNAPAVLLPTALAVNGLFFVFSFFRFAASRSVPNNGGESIRSRDLSKSFFDFFGGGRDFSHPNNANARAMCGSENTAVFIRHFSIAIAFVCCRIRFSFVCSIKTIFILCTPLDRSASTVNKT